MLAIINSLLVLFVATANAQTSNISLGKVNTSAPSYLNNSINPLSLDLTGALRTTSTISGTVAVTQGTSPWVVSNSGTFAVQAAQSGTWNIGTLTSITNPVTVTQSTAANLNATVVGTGTFGVQATLSSETTKVIGTVNQGTSPWVISGNLTNISGTISLPTGAATAANQTNVQATPYSGALTSKVVVVGAYQDAFEEIFPLTVDPSGKLLVSADISGSSVTISGQPLSASVFSVNVPNAAMNNISSQAGLNASLAAVFDDSAPTAITEDNFGYLRMSNNRNLYGTIRDAAGNERGVNVTSGNSLQIDNKSIGGVTTSVGNGVVGTGVQRVAIASDNTAFSVNAVQSGTWTVQPGNTANTTPWLISPIPATSGGLSNYFVQPTASDNHVVIKAGAGQVYKIDVFNNSATVNYLRLYNATTGFNGCNSATNLVGQWQIPASTSVGGISSSWDLGLAFSTGISICVTSAYATTDTTNATASAMSVNIGYK